MKIIHRDKEIILHTPQGKIKGKKPIIDIEKTVDTIVSIQDTKKVLKSILKDIEVE